MKLGTKIYYVVHWKHRNPNNKDTFRVLDLTSSRENIENSVKLVNEAQHTNYEIYAVEECWT